MGSNREVRLGLMKIGLGIGLGLRSLGLGIRSLPDNAKKTQCLVKNKNLHPLQTSTPV